MNPASATIFNVLNRPHTQTEAIRELLLLPTNLRSSARRSPSFGSIGSFTRFGIAGSRDPDARLGRCGDRPLSCVAAFEGNPEKTSPVGHQTDTCLAGSGKASERLKMSRSF